MSLSLPSGSPDAGAPTVNKRELARLLKVSIPTVSEWIERFELPSVARGTNGREWKFDPAAIIEILRQKQAETAAAGAARDEQLAQLVLPLDLFSEPPQPGLSIKDQMDAIRLRRLQREEAERLGMLVPAAAVSHALTTALTLWNRLVRNAIRAAAADHNLPDAVTRSIDQRLADAQRQFVREAADLLTTEEPPSDAPRFALG